jgi:hypothetical protein
MDNVFLANSRDTPYKWPTSQLQIRRRMPPPWFVYDPSRPYAPHICTIHPFHINHNCEHTVLHVLFDTIRNLYLLPVYMSNICQIKLSKRKCWRFSYNIYCCMSTSRNHEMIMVGVKQLAQTLIEKLSVVARHVCGRCTRFSTHTALYSCTVRLCAFQLLLLSSHDAPVCFHGKWYDLQYKGDWNSLNSCAYKNTPTLYTLQYSLIYVWIVSFQLVLHLWMVYLILKLILLFRNFGTNSLMWQFFTLVNNWLIHAVKQHDNIWIREEELISKWPTIR